MPIKELIAVSTAILASVFVTHPGHFHNALREIKMQILREVTRTDNWGSPSIFSARTRNPRR
jgi:hypothetical protein